MRNCYRPRVAALTPEQRRAERVRLFAVLAALLLAPLYLLGLMTITAGVAVAAVTGTTVGAAGVADGPDAHRVPSVSDVLTRIEPSRFPFTTFLDRLSRTAPAEQIVHRWPEVSRYPRSVTVNGVTTAGTANANKQITVQAVNLIKAGDILQSPANGTDASLMYFVVSVDSATQLTLRALPKDTTGSTPYTAINFGTVPVFANAEVLYWVGNAKSESDQASAARAMQPAYPFNYVQTFDLSIEFSDHKMRSKNYGPNDIGRYRQDNLLEFRKNQEYSAIFNTAPSVVADPGDGKLIWTMRGLKGAVSETINLSTTGGTPSESQIVDFIYAAFNDSNASERKMLMGGTDFMKTVDKAALGNLFTRREEKIAGVMVNSIIGRKGRLDTVYHPGFDEMGYGGQGVIIDLDHIIKRDYQTAEKRKLMLKETGKDAEGEYYIAKWTLEVRNTGAHKWCTKS